MDSELRGPRLTSETRMTRSEFTKRVGDPKKLVFKGQCFDTGLINRQHCACCDREIRQVFVLFVNGARVYFGSGCIDLFRNWNKPLHRKLVAARIWLRTWIAAEVRDSRVTRRRDQLQLTEKEYNRLRKEAALAVRNYHHATGKQWLPEELFALKDLADQPRPRLTAHSRARWFNRRVVALRQALTIYLPSNPGTPRNDGLTTTTPYATAAPCLRARLSARVKVSPLRENMIIKGE